MFRAKVYNIMIGAPSDIQEEIQIAIDTIHEWTDTNSELNKIVLRPINWIRNTYPTIGTHPQKSINRQIVSKSDLMICMFGAKIGTKTDTSLSGSIEEIEEHKKAGKNTIVLFRENINRSDIDWEQCKALEEYKRNHSDELYWGKYNDEKDFKEILQRCLQLFLNDTWLNPDYKPTEINEDVTITLDKSELIIPCKAKKYISVSNIELDKCKIKIEEDYYANAWGSNGKIEIDGNKVGSTKLIVLYGNNKAECLLKITPMNNFCGSPILQFGISYSEIRAMFDSVYKEDESGFTCKEGDILHHYLFDDNKLVLVVSCIKLKDSSSHFLDASNSMNERYNHLPSSNNIYLYQQPVEQFYIASVEDRQRETWFFFYSDSEDLINKNIEQFKH